jgi:misacylated tRNA(Ala) deacylase
MTERLFLEDARLREAEAVVIASGPEGIVLDRTIFYARSGGQPGDAGIISWDGGKLQVAEAVKGEGDIILHPCGDTPLPAPGTSVSTSIDWVRRHRLMRMHTALHLLCSVLPGAGVTGGQIGLDRSRLDFDLRDPPAKDTLQERLAAAIAGDHVVRTEWVDESVLDTHPTLVRTLSVKPPRGSGRLRLVRIGDSEPPVDLQPCGGTHVVSTAEIGPISIQKTENKGKQNRRITIVFAEAG